MRTEAWVALAELQSELYSMVDDRTLVQYTVRSSTNVPLLKEKRVINWVGDQEYSH